MLQATAVNKLADTQYEITFGVADLTDTDPNQTSPAGTYRWRDIDDNLYAATYKASYDYSNPEVSVQLDFEPVDSSFGGTLTATGLKPNFLYQAKLIGQPYRGEAGGPYNDAANESIGYAGRWWQQEWNGSAWVNGQNLNNKGDGSSPSPNDLVYQDRVDDLDIIGGSPTGLRYLYEGYMPFDYFITDEDGDATLDFGVDSAYHVMWKTSQRARAVDEAVPVVGDGGGESRGGEQQVVPPAVALATQDDGGGDATQGASLPELRKGRSAAGVEVERHDLGGLEAGLLRAHQTALPRRQTNLVDAASGERPRPMVLPGQRIRCTHDERRHDPAAGQVVEGGVELLGGEVSGDTEEHEGVGAFDRH